MESRGFRRRIGLLALGGLLAAACSGRAPDRAPPEPVSEAAGTDGVAANGVAATADPDLRADPVLLPREPAGAPRASRPAGAASPDPDVLVVDGILNGGFEWIADDTTEPPKYGAYWRGAFAPVEGDPTDLVEERDDAHGGRRVLHLPVAGGTALQKVVADPRWTDRLIVHLAWRSLGGAALEVTVEDGRERRTAVPLRGREDGWTEASLDLGARFVAEHGERPMPRLNVSLQALPGDGGEVGAVEVDDIRADVSMPRVDERQLAAAIADLARWLLDIWLPLDADSAHGYVDRRTGYVLVDGFDVETGGAPRWSRSTGFHTLHTVLVDWLEIAHLRGWDDDIARWTPHLERIVTTILDRNFHPETGLPRTISVKSGKPNDDSAQDVGAWLEFLADAAPLLTDEELGRRAVAQVRTMADTLLALQAEHDQDPSRVFNAARLDQATGILHGRFPNWFGHIPNKLAATGEIDTPRRFNTAWAIVTQRSFWYHLFRSPTAIMMANKLAPRPGDLAGVRRALSLYHRDWDAARYDLENDTDDHYGYLSNDLITLLEQSGGEPPRALELVQSATDHRLDRNAASVDETLWIQAVRLGASCAGDSPRAIRGVARLYLLPPEINPVSSGLPLYRDAVLELAANDFKGRQLTNGQFTESFFKLWEMVCICFHGTYQGDCRERPLSEWHGDVGDIFGGPPMKSIEAQIWAYRVADEVQRAEIRARLATILHVTEQGLMRPYGMLYGLDPAIARQYELPDKYTTGLEPRTAAALGHLKSWLGLLPHLAADDER